MNWVTEITHVKDFEYFVDEQRFGPYKFWHHKHLIKEIKIKQNKCKLIVGKIVSLHIDKKLLEKDGFLSLNKGEIPTIGGCDGYYIPKDYVRKEYQKPNKK